MAFKHWLLRKLGATAGTQAVLDHKADHHAGVGDKAERSGGVLDSTMAVQKFDRLYERILDPMIDERSLGFRKDQMPCLIDMNGDLLWIPADLLKFIWHTVVSPSSSIVPRFLAETGHYLWIRDRLRPGDIVLDIGANIGLFTTMMASRVGANGSVHAFEPSPRICDDLRRVLLLNEMTNVVVNQCAVSDSCGLAAFLDIDEPNVRREASHLGALGRLRMLGVLKHAVVEVEAITVDAYVREKHIVPRLIKVDVEGAELLVLEGARTCIKSAKPALVIEVHPDERGVFDWVRLESYLEQCGYSYELQDKVCLCD